MQNVRENMAHGLFYHPGIMLLNGYVDTDYAGDTTDRKALSEYIIKHGSRPCFTVHASRRP